MTNLHDTQPNKPVNYPLGRDTGGGPPRLLFWGVIIVFLLIVVGAIATVVVYREVLSPSQRVRVLDMAPFMAVFNEPTPSGGVLPTAVPNEENSDAAMDLLNMPTVEVTDEATEEATQEALEPTVAATEEMTQDATNEPTAVSAINTEIPAETPLPRATAIPAATITSSPVAQAQLESQPEQIPVGNGLPATARMYGFTHQQQTWNNCGPATITMSLSYFGWHNDQSYAADFLKPNREDKNVSPYELAGFVNEQTAVRALVRMGGDIELLKALIANNFPVIIETGAYFEAYDWIGHYRAAVAYDDTQNTFFFYDSFMGTGDFEQGVTVSYEETDDLWRNFNRIFIVIYLPEEEARLMSILGERSTELDAAQHAFDVAQEEARANPQDGFAWFNMGTSLTELGRYQEAATAFDQARRLGLPWRMLWYQFSPLEAYYNIGRYDDVLSLVQTNLNNAEELEEMYYWRGQVYMAQNRQDQAATAFRQALSYNPEFTAAREALDSLS